MQEKRQGKALFSVRKNLRGEKSKMKRLFVVIALLAVAIFALSACAPAAPPAVEKEEIKFSPLPLAGMTILAPPNNVPAEMLPREIQVAQQVIRGRLPNGQLGNEQFDQLIRIVNRLHNRMLQPDISGKLQTTGAKALRGIYTILWKLATREFFIIIMPVDDCMMMFKLQLESPECSPQLRN